MNMASIQNLSRHNSSTRSVKLLDTFVNSFIDDILELHVPGYIHFWISVKIASIPMGPDALEESDAISFAMHLNIYHLMVVVVVMMVG